MEKNRYNPSLIKYRKKNGDPKMGNANLKNHWRRIVEFIE